MTIRGYDPLADLLNLQERMNGLFEESLVRLEPPLLASTAWTPPADVYEAPDSYVVQVELPGLDRESIDIRVDEGQLTVRGERQASRLGGGDCYHRVERSYGPFSRTFRFSAKIDPNQTETDFEDGLLRILARKSDSTARRTKKRAREQSPD